MNTLIQVVNCTNATPQNVKDALRLNEAIFDDEITISPDIHKNFKPSIWVFIYTITPDGKVLVGKADLTFKTSTIANNTIKKCKISNLGILPFMQGNNLGTTLLAECVSVCKQNNCDYVYLNCKATPKLKTFYAKNNFTLVSTNNITPLVKAQTKNATMIKALSNRCIKNPKVVNFDVLQELQQTNKMAKSK